MSVIDDYLENLDPEQKAGLERIRVIAKEIVPDVEEVISYRMPVLKYKGAYLIGFAAFKDHLSLFPGAEPIEDLKRKLTGFKLSKGTIQFTPDNPIPEALVKEIIAVCLDRITKTKKKY
jgi:uncharacterized protein YdhG (YjbR/CyaY superfamily)